MIIKIFFTLLMVLHSFIHSLGFLKAYALVSLDDFPISVSEGQGMVWAVAMFLFLVSLSLFWLKRKHWWLVSIIAVFISQSLIIINWQSAKFGTLPNLVMTGAIILGMSFWRFDKQIEKEKKHLLTKRQQNEQPQHSASLKSGLINLQMLQDLPEPVQHWLSHAGIVGKPPIQTVHLKQQGMMRLKPEQNTWMQTKAEQHFTVHKPAFLWHVQTAMLGLPILGRDLFDNGQGSMQIKLAGLIPVVKVDDHPKLNESTLQRFLGEIVWFPSAALSPYIQWEMINENKAKATMKLNETEGSAEFHFNDEGDLTQFIAYRYKDISDEKPLEWRATVKKTEVFHGIRIPTELEATWILEDGPFTWYDFRISEIHYN